MQVGFPFACAVKSLNADVGLEARIEFLKEAATMKKCRLRKCHAILFIGPVSDGAVDKDARFEVIGGDCTVTLVSWALV